MLKINFTICFYKDKNIKLKFGFYYLDFFRTTSPQLPSNYFPCPCQSKQQRG